MKTLKTTRGTGHQKNFLERFETEDAYRNMGRTNPKVKKRTERTKI